MHKYSQKQYKYLLYYSSVGKKNFFKISRGVVGTKASQSNLTGTVVNLFWGSSLLYKTQLLDVFSYELPAGQLGVYIKYSFALGCNVVSFFKIKGPVRSVEFFFNNAGWFERELSEMSGVSFTKKGDTRALLLPYGNTSTPLKKAYHSVGFFEIFYSLKVDALKIYFLSQQL